MFNPIPGPESLLALAFPSDPQISPDGQRVAFVLMRVEEDDPKKPDEDFARPRYKSHLWLSNGGAATQLTQGESRDAAPRWSPDGQTLAFVRDGQGRKGQLYLLPLGGGEARRITDFKGAVQDVQYSPDGRFLAFFSAGDDEDKRDGRGEARVITRPRYRFNGRDWLPERPARLWRYDMGADTLTEWHAPESEITGYSWQPDSAGVLFIASTDEMKAVQWQQEVYRLPLDGSPTQLTHWNSAISTVIPHPDGGRFVLVGRPEGKGSPENSHLFLVEQDGNWRRLAVGDLLLIQGNAARIDSLGEYLAVMGDLTGRVRDPRRAPLAVALFVGAVGLGAFGVLPLAVAVVVAVALSLIFRLISPEEAYSAVEWPILVLIASMLAFGTAFEATGAAGVLTGALSGVLEPLGPYGLLGALFVVTVALTQPMSNQAAALVMLPLAIGTAKTLGYDPRPFIIGITIAASNSFITPLEPSCMLVYGPGRYTFMDFVRVGSGLTLVTFAVAMLIIPRVWPF